MSFQHRRSIAHKDLIIDYKEIRLLRRCMTENAKIMPARMTGFSRSQQKLLKQSIERARFLALIQYTVQ